MTHPPGEQLSALLDGEMGPADAAALRAHIASCASCREAMASVETARGALRALPLVAPPDGLTTRVAGRIRAVARRWARVAVVAAALTAVVVFVAAPDTEVAPATASPGGDPAGRVDLDRVATPTRIGPMVLTGAYRRGETVSAVYQGDGYLLTVVARPGSMGAVPGMTPAVVGGRSGELRPGTATEVFAWQDGPDVVSAVGPPAAVADAPEALPAARPYGLFARMRRAARTVVSALTGFR
ncbi:MAG TPA: anti-sigma factor [Acidimicrobiales bacterium]|nr:anti-sigma factor [Acidimicrobiales bacterium]